MKKLLLLAFVTIILSWCGLWNTKSTDKIALQTNSWWLVTKMAFGDDDMTDNSIDKMNSYVDVRNYVDPSLNDSIAVYIDRANDKSVITDLTKVPENWWLLNMSGEEYIIKAKSMLTSGTKIQFDKLADPYISTFAKLYTQNNKLYNYYHSEEYKKDNFAKWQTLHKELIALLDIYDKVYPDFIANYNERFLSLQLDNMRYYKSNGQTAKYAVESISLYKKYLMNEVDSIDKKINQNQKIDSSEFNKYIAKYEESVKYINTQINKTIIKDDLWDNNIQTFDSIKKIANEILASAKELASLINNYDKINIEKINSIIDKLYDLEETIIWLRNQTIN